MSKPAARPQISQGTSSHLRWNQGQFEAELSGLLAEPALVALFVFHLLLGEDGFVIGLASGKQAVDDTRQLMCCIT